MKPRQILDCNKSLLGKRIKLERLGSGHLGFLLKSYANREFWASYRYNEMLNPNPERLAEQLDFDYQQTPATAGKIEWVITVPTRKGERSVGFACLAAFDETQHRAEFLIGIVEPRDIKNGVGLESSLLVMDYAFNVAGLTELLSYVFVDNDYGQKSTLALGFLAEKQVAVKFLRDGEEISRRMHCNKLSLDGFRNSERLAKLSVRLLGRNISQPDPGNSVINRKTSANAGLHAKFEL